MRDPQRIDVILEKVRALWINNPDQRFGQLVSNAMFGLSGFGRDPYFYVEDDKLEAHLNRVLDQGVFNPDSGGEYSPVNF